MPEGVVDAGEDLHVGEDPCRPCLQNGRRKGVNMSLIGGGAYPHSSHKY